MIQPGWLQKDKSERKRPRLVGGPAASRQSDASRLAAKLRPHELIAMLTHHYTRARARSLPKVAIRLCVLNSAGKPAVTIIEP
jgi:hypothetical protein